jgi:hypothetical protein
MLRHLNEAAELEVLGTRNADEGLHTIPVGAAVCGQHCDHKVHNVASAIV